MSHAFSNYLKEQGIRHEVTVAYSPEQNGVAERMNRTLCEAARAMLSHAHLEKEYWAEAIATAAYVRNRLPTSSLQGDITPYEKWYGRKPDISHLRVFGCTAYAHIPDQRRQKLDVKTEKLRFVGYSIASKAYKLFNVQTRKMVIRRDVVFNETDFECETTNTRQVSTKVEVDLEIQENVSTNNASTTQELSTRPTRVRHPPVRYGIDEFADKAADVRQTPSLHRACDIIEPQTIDQAKQSSEAKEWLSAAESEYKSLMDNNVWDLVPLPPGRTPIGCKWVFRAKPDANGMVERFKGRLVAKGYAQQPGVDYEETFAPVVRFTSIRALLAYALQRNMLIHQMDVETAFLNSTLDEEIYMNQPDGFIEPGQKHLVCKLKKSLYGLKQSPRCWNSVLNHYLQSLKFVRSDADMCVYIRNDDGVKTIVAVYVDDLIVLSDTEQAMTTVKQDLASRFKMKDLGKLHYCLGINIDQDKKTIKLHQQHYILQILKRFGMENSNPVSTPADVNVKLVKDDGISKPVEQKNYQAIIGSLLYLSIATRPDISQAVGVASKFCAAPTEAHLTAVKRILRYLKGSLDSKIVYHQTPNTDVVGYTDANWAGDLDDRRSTSGNVFLLAGGPISWTSKRQSVVAVSTAESEYIALFHCTQEALWLCKLMKGINQAEAVEPMKLYIDNQAAIKIASNFNGHGRIKHMDIKYHFTRDAIIHKHVHLVYCPTKDMVADIFTKSTPREKFVSMRNLMGIID